MAILSTSRESHDIMGIPLNTCGGAIFFSIASIIYYFRFQTTVPSWEGVLGITIPNFKETDPSAAENGNFLHPPAVFFKNFKPGGHLVYVKGIPMTSWEFPLIHVAVPFSSVLQILFIIL